MGVLRLLLALAVVLSHASLEGFFGITLVGGQAAVQTFYMISGFYMALILNEKYPGLKNYGLFLSNRMLRLFPAYWAVAAITLIVCGVSAVLCKNPLLLSSWLTEGQHLNFWSKALLVLSNFAIFGQDAALFLRQDASGWLVFTSNWAAHPHPVWSYLLIPQAWSLSLELTFYLIAPFIVTRKPVLLAFMALSFVVRACLVSAGLTHDPWIFRFFPNELGLFLVGSFGYHFYAERLKSKPANMKLQLALAAIVYALTFAFRWLPIADAPTKFISYYLIVAISLPWLFNWTKNSKIDHYIGELSYPVYICHFTIIAVLQMFVHSENGLAGTSSVLSVLFAAALTQLIVKPVDAYRQKRIARSKQKSETAKVGDARQLEMSGTGRSS